MKNPRTLKEALKGKLSEKELSFIPSSFDVIGDIGIFADYPKELEKKEKLIADSLMSLHNNIRTVLKKTKKYSGKFRLPKLKIISGKRTKEAEYKENNIRLKLNVEKVYFSPRLGNERKRVSQIVKENESVLVMFSGCGIYPLVISKNAKPKEVYAIEMNPVAHKYAEENIKLNKITNIRLFLGDVNKVLPKIKKKFDRILMPLPKGAEDFLDIALSNIKKKGIIHFYDFLKEDEFGKAVEKIDAACKKRKKKCKILNIVKCGQFGPRIYRVCVDFRV